MNRATTEDRVDIFFELWASFVSVRVGDGQVANVALRTVFNPAPGAWWWAGLLYTKKTCTGSAINSNLQSCPVSLTFPLTFQSIQILSMSNARGKGKAPDDMEVEVEEQEARFFCPPTSLLRPTPTFILHTIPELKVKVCILILSLVFILINCSSPSTRTPMRNPTKPSHCPRAPPCGSKTWPPRQ